MCLASYDDQATGIHSRWIAGSQSQGVASVLEDIGPKYPSFLRLNQDLLGHNVGTNVPVRRLEIDYITSPHAIEISKGRPETGAMSGDSDVARCTRLSGVFVPPRTSSERRRTRPFGDEQLVGFCSRALSGPRQLRSGRSSRPRAPQALLVTIEDGLG